MTCRIAVRRSPESELDGRQQKIADLRAVVEDSKRQVARSQVLIDHIDQRLHTPASS